jgi:hypothetical protein
MSETDTQQEGQEPKAAPEAKDETAPEGKAPEGDAKTFDEGYVKELRAENAQRRIDAQQLKEKLEEFEERDKSELEKAQGKVAKAEQTAAEATAKLLRFEVASEKKVPAEAVDFLQGSTREDLEASADKILALVNKPDDKDTKPDFDGGAREPAPESDPVSSHNELITKLTAGLISSP